jgi:NADPH:quinone reductase-like Zn-dependent oxidoreductase
MQVKLLHSYGKKDIAEYTHDIGEMSPNQILVKTQLVGCCRSDISAYAGWERPMPFGQFGHEGLGIVKKCGSNITDVKEGDIVATFSDPAYADHYYAKHGEYTKVKELHQRHILQPVACGVNIWLETKKMMDRMGYSNEQVLLIGSGFLSMIIGKTVIWLSQSHDTDKRIDQSKFDIVGNANQDFWQQSGFNRFRSLNDIQQQYKVVIDLSSKAEYFDIIVNNITATEGLVCYASTPTSPVTTNFFEACWKCLTFVLPSPRNSGFSNAMDISEKIISGGWINVDSQWTQGYPRNDMTQVKQAFEDGANRKPGYVRGFIDFRN